MKKALIILSAIALMFFSFMSCSVKHIAYNREKMLKKYSQYTVYLNNEKIALDTLYFDKQNIQSIALNKKELNINITQRNPNTEYLLLMDYCADTLNFLGKKNCLIIIDGVSVNENVQIEKNAIKEIEYLKSVSDGKIYCGVERGVILVVTKQN